MVDRVYNNKDTIVPLTLSPEKEIEDNLQTIFDPNADLTLNEAKKWLESLPTCGNSRS